MCLFSLHLRPHMAFRGACVGLVYFFVSGFLLTEPEGHIKDEAAPLSCVLISSATHCGLSQVLSFRVTVCHTHREEA